MTGLMAQRAGKCFGRVDGVGHVARTARDILILIHTRLRFIFIGAKPRHRTGFSHHRTPVGDIACSLVMCTLQHVEW